jgi:hypothetical protein
MRFHDDRVTIDSEEVAWAHSITSQSCGKHKQMRSRNKRQIEVMSSSKVIPQTDLISLVRRQGGCRITSTGPQF